MRNSNKNNEIFWIVSGQALNVIGVLLFLKIAAKTVSPDEFGRFILALTITTIINQVYTGGVVAAFSRYYAIAVERSSISDFTNAVVYLG